VIGTLAGSYRIVDTLSVGGMGTVYRAEHTLLGRMAAVKVLNPEMSTSRDIVNRFFNEARATTSIKHPGIIEVFDFGYLESGNAYLVMELLEGAPLSVRNRARGRIPEHEAAAILRLVCSALTAAHAKGIVHRDLKPDNIFLIPDPDSQLGERPKLLDFGIAKLTDIGLAGTATKTGAVMGTPTYMSPEQCRGTGEVDHRADLYSIGCIFYELLTGRPPFIDRGAGELIGAHLFMQPEPPSRHAAGISPDTEALIMSLLAKNPAERPQTASDLAHRLAPIAARGGFGSSVSWDGVRVSMPYVTAQPGDATRYPTPSHTPVPTPMRAPMPTPQAPMLTPQAAMTAQAAMTPHVPLPTPHAPAKTTDPTTLSGAASQVSAGGGSSKRIVAIAGLTILAGGVALAVAFSGHGGGTEQAAPAAAAAPETVHVPAPAPAPTAVTPAPAPAPAAVTPAPAPAPAAVTPAPAPAPAAVTPSPAPPAPPAAPTPPPVTTAAKPDKPEKPAKPTTAATKPKTTKPAKPAKPGKSDNPLLETDVE
jgi:serine/threonine-protein kinase